MNHTTLAKAYELEQKELETLLETSHGKGLSKEVSEKRLQSDGPNAIVQEEKSSLVKDVFKQLMNPLALILLGALALTLVLGEYLDAIVILIATLINVVIAVNQERRAGAAFQALSSRRAHEAIVIREGEQQVIDLQHLVVGDLVVLQSGQYVPADGRIVNSTRLAVNQVVFTGESRAIKKDTGISHEKNPYDRNNMVFMGSTVVTGTGLMLVVGTALHTEFGKIAHNLSMIEKDLSPIQRSMKKIAQMLGIATTIALVLLIAIGFLRGFDIYTIVLLAVAVGVSAVPEGLLSAVTVVLAYGARLIMKKGGLVKNLASAETLGSATYILTDKTGTLTYGEMKTEGWFTFGDEEGDVEKLQTTSALATDVFYDEHTHAFVGDQMDTAIAKTVWKFKEQLEESTSKHKIIDSIPFDSLYKFFASLRKSDKGLEFFTKGAPDLLLEHAQFILHNGRKIKITDEHRDYFREVLVRESREGRRLLAVGYSHDDVDKDTCQRAWREDGHAVLPEGLVLYGLVSFYDKVRSGVTETIENMRKDETRVVMVTGDSAETAHRIALESGIITSEKEAVYTGEDIDSYTDEHLIEIMHSGLARVFARVTPDHKLRLATILQAQGEVVAMTGDGVNDAPALQRATIGISLSSSTEVAKEASDLVLVDDSFNTIAFAIDEGRRMVANLKKTIIYLLSTSFSEVLVLLGSLVVGGPTPFYPAQILWANIIEEGLMNFAFIFEPNHHENQKDKTQHIIMNTHTKKMILSIGIANGLLLFGFYMGLLWINIEGDLLRTYMFAALSIDSVFFGIALKSLYSPIWRVKLFSNTYLIAASLVSFALLVVALEVPFMRTLLHLEPLGVVGLEVVFAFGLINLFIVEIIKKIAR